MALHAVQFPGFALITAGLLGVSSPSLAAQSSHQLLGHLLPASVTEGAKRFEPANKTLSLAIRLPMQNASQLDELLDHLYTPGDPLYGKYLTPQEFTSRFGATRRSFDHVVKYFRNLGCAIGAKHLNRLLLDVKCPQSAVEREFRITVSHWLTPDNEEVQTIDTEPTVPSAMPIEAINGLSSIPRHMRLMKLNSDTGAVPATGSGPKGGLSPSDIKTAYNLNSISENGAGQTLGLFELDGYQATDISAYASNFSISPVVSLQNVLIDGASGNAGSGAAEVTLDIELMMAVAPGASKIIVYEGPNSDTGLIDVYQRIANDNAAKQISTSWGAPEGNTSSATLNSENQIFKQMASQGQSLYAAAGDSGADDNGTSLSVDDPASQPYATAAGGTTITTNTDHTYSKETTWWNASTKQGGGGGISAVWPIPSWQVSAVSSISGGSTTQRNVPDVALDADPSTGYAIYVGGAWNVYGGTSCAAPLWAAYTSLVNQRRATGGLFPLGYANPAIYQVAQGSNYATDFHDIADGSTNGHYVAVTGYDLATGWGSLDGANLLTDLAAVVTPSPTPAPSPTPSPSPSPAPPAAGCNSTRTPMSGGQSTSFALSYSLPFAVGWVVRRKKKAS